MNISKHTITMAAIALALSACGKSEQGAAQGAAEAMDKSKAAAADVKKEVVKSAELPQADKSTPEGKYNVVNSGAQLAYLYYAVSGMPVDYENLAGIMSSDYRSTTNAFKKQEILNSLKPMIEAQIAKYKENRYVVVDADFQLDHIDMQTKSFPLRGVPSGREYIYFQDSSNYKLGITNGEAFGKYKAGSDELARELEDLVEKYKAAGQARIYLYAQDIDLNSHVVKFQAVKVQFKTRDGKVLPEMI